MVKIGCGAGHFWELAVKGLSLELTAKPLSTQAVASQLNVYHQCYQSRKQILFLKTSNTVAPKDNENSAG